MVYLSPPSNPVRRSTTGIANDGSSSGGLRDLIKMLMTVRKRVHIRLDRTYSGSESREYHCPPSLDDPTQVPLSFITPLPPATRSLPLRSLLVSSSTLVLPNVGHLAHLCPPPATTPSPTSSRPPGNDKLLNAICLEFMGPP